MSAQQDEAQALLEQGAALYEQGYLYDALRCWKRTLDLDPHNEVAQEYIDFIKGYFNITVEEAIAQCEAAEAAAANMEGLTSVSQPPQMPPPEIAAPLEPPPPPSPPNPVRLSAPVQQSASSAIRPSAPDPLPGFAPDLDMQLGSLLQPDHVEEIDEPPIDLGPEVELYNAFDQPTPLGQEAAGEAEAKAKAARPGGAPLGEGDESLELLESAEREMVNIDPMALPTSHFSEPKAPDAPQPMLETLAQRPARERRRLPTGAMEEIHIGGPNGVLATGGYELLFEGEGSKSSRVRAEDSGSKPGLGANRGNLGPQTYSKAPVSASQQVVGARMPASSLDQSRQDPSGSLSKAPPAGGAQSAFAGSSPSTVRATSTRTGVAVPPPIPQRFLKSKPSLGMPVQTPKRSISSYGSSLPIQNWPMEPSSGGIQARILESLPSGNASPAQSLQNGPSIAGPKPQLLPRESSVVPPMGSVESNGAFNSVEKSEQSARLPVGQRPVQKNAAFLTPAPAPAAANSGFLPPAASVHGSSPLTDPPPADVDWSAAGFLSSDPLAPKPQISPDLMGIASEMAGFENDFGKMLNSSIHGSLEAQHSGQAKAQEILMEDLGGFDPWKEGEDPWAEAEEAETQKRAKAQESVAAETVGRPGEFPVDQVEIIEEKDRSSAPLPEMPLPSAPPDHPQQLPSDVPNVPSVRVSESSRSQVSASGFGSTLSNPPTPPSLSLPPLSGKFNTISNPPPSAQNPFAKVPSKVHQQSDLQTQAPASASNVAMSDLDAFLQGELAGMADLAIGNATTEKPQPKVQPQYTQADCEQWRKEAQECLRQGDLYGAYLKWDDIQQVLPADEDAQQFMSENQVRLQSLLLSNLGSLQKVPRLKISKNELIWQSLDHKSGFLLSQIDGLTSYEDLIAISCMPEFEAMRILVRFLKKDLIR